MRFVSMCVPAILLAAFCPNRQASAANVDLSVEPSTSMEVTETQEAVSASADVDLVMWRFGYNRDLGRNWGMSLSYANGGGHGGVVRDLDRQDYDLTFARVLYQSPADRQRPAAVACGLGYHITSFKFPSFNVLGNPTRQDYEGLTLGVRASQVLRRDEKGQVSGALGVVWMPDLSGGRQYDGMEGDGTSVTLSLTYRPVESSLSYTLGYKIASFQGDISAQNFSMDEDYKGFWFGVGTSLK